MRVSIIGGGPAGLYLASAIKKNSPNARVDVYEVLNESMTSFGLGYTLQQLNTTLLGRLDQNFYTSLFPDTSSPLITQALFKTNHDAQTLKFSDGFSVTRFELMRYLRELSQERGVNIIERKITGVELETLRKNSDLLIGADGGNSVVRNKYAKQFKAKSLLAKTKHSWFINETEQKRSEACFYAFKAPEGVIMLTSYPLTENKQVVIIEMSDQCANSGNFKDKSPVECEDYLSQILSQNGDLMSLKSAGLPWYSFKMNTTQNLHYKNVALIGDAAIALHFCRGQGVTSAFTMAYTLSQCIEKSPSLNGALQHYSNTINAMYREPVATSFANIDWFENVDDHFDNTPSELWLDLFLKKEQFKQTA
jgi:2-polyprenyl-6-methoxyphenol hydroxylase-like FAD-dependent oxidoreductase